MSSFSSNGTTRPLQRPDLLRHPLVKHGVPVLLVCLSSCLPAGAAAAAGQGRRRARDLRARVGSRLGLETKDPFILAPLGGGAEVENATEVKPQTGFITKTHVSLWHGDEAPPTGIFRHVCEDSVNPVSGLCLVIKAYLFFMLVMNVETDEAFYPSWIF